MLKERVSNASGFAIQTRQSLQPTSSLLVLVPAFGLAVIFGLFSPLLGLESWFGLAVILTAFSVLLAASGILYAGVQGRKWAMWFVFFVVAVAMEGTIRRRELTATGLDGQTLFKLLVWSGGFVIGAAHYSYVKSVVLRSFGLRWLLAFGVWAFVSTFYSLTPTYTFGGGFAFLALIFFTSAVIERNGKDSVLMPMVFACGLLTLSAIALYVVAPSIVVAQSEGGKIPRLAGLTGSPNNLGRVASLGLLFIFFAVQRRLIRVWRLDIALIIASCVACLLLSWSRTSIAALVVSILVVKLRRRPWLLLGAASLALMIFLLLLVGDFNWNHLVKLISRRGSLEELLTFTGRTAIWEFNWHKFLQQPIIGYGYGATKLLMPEGFRTYLGWTSTSAHSMILQALVTTGLVGGVLVIATHIWQFRAFFRQPTDFPDAIFVYVVLSGLFEPGAVGVAPNMLTLIWIMSLAIPRSSTDKPSTEQGGS